MGGRSGQSTGGGGGGGGVNSYLASDANTPITEMSKINDNYQYVKIEDRDAATIQNWEKIINAYTNRGYKVNYDIVDNQLSQNDIKYIKALNASLDKLPSVKGTFYRGMVMKEGSRTEKLVNSLLANKGKSIKLNTFFSTSEDKDKARVFATSKNNNSVFFTVIGKNGKSIEKLSSHSYEKEVLFKTNSKYKVTAATQTVIEGKKIVTNITLTEK